MPELPEVETVRRRLEPVLVGRQLRARRDRRPAADAAGGSGRGRGRAHGRARRGGRAARQVSGCSVRERSRSPDPPPDDGEPSARAGGTAVDVSHRRAVVKLDDGSDVVYRDVRRFGTWLLRRAGRARPVPRARGSAASRSGRTFTAKALAARSSRTARRRSRRRCSTSARSPASGTSTSTRRSGARASIRCARRASSTGDEVGAARRDQEARSPRASRARARRCATTASRTAARGSMQKEFKVYGRGGEPCDRCGTPIEKTRVARPRHVVLPDLPERGSGGELLVELAGAVEPPELGVAADHLVADQDLRHRPAAGELVQLLAEGGSSSSEISSNASPRERAAPSPGRSSRTSASCRS